MEASVIDYVLAYAYGAIGATAYVLFVELRIPERWSVREDILYVLLGGFISLLFFLFGTRDPAALALAGYFSISLAHPMFLSKLLYNELREFIESEIAVIWKKLKEEEGKKEYGGS